LPCCSGQAGSIGTAAAALALVLATAGAQLLPAQTMNMKDMADMAPVPPPEQLPVPIHMTGIGNSHIAIKANPDAQVWFDQD